MNTLSETERKVLDLLAKHRSLTLMEIASMVMELPGEAAGGIERLKSLGLVTARSIRAEQVSGEEAFSLAKRSRRRGTGQGMPE